MISIFQDIIGRIAVFVSSIAISLGILTAPTVIPSSQQPATIVSITETEQTVATQEGKPILIVVTPILTPTLTPTPYITPCEATILAILPEVEGEYLKQESIKKARLEIEWCAFTENDPQKKKEDCQKWNEELLKRQTQKIADKMNEYKAHLTACTGQEVKFSRYSSKIPTEY